MSGQRFVQWFLLVVGWLLIAPPTSAQEQEPAVPRHEAFTRDMPMFSRSAIVSAEYERDGTVVLVDGRAVPVRFSLDPCAGVLRDQPIAEVAGPIEFVLVMPGEVAIDNVELAVARPFYLAVMPLDQAQLAANMFGLGEGYLDYESFRDSEKLLARFNPRHTGETIAFLDEYLANPALPAVRQDVASASKVLLTLSGTSGLRTRLPTLGEWFVAVRGGSETGPFWTGHEPPWDEVVWHGVFTPGFSREDGPAMIRPAAGASTSHPLGLRDMVGGVADLVFPSEAERVALSERMAESVGDAAGHLVQSHTAFRLGAGIDGVRDDSMTENYGREGGLRALEQAMFRHSLTHWIGLVLECQITANAGWLYHDRWATGLRPVIELPEGEVTVRGVAPDAEP